LKAYARLLNNILNRKANKRDGKKRKRVCGKWWGKEMESVAEKLHDYEQKENMRKA
jgi:hypothetical protein